VTVGSAAHIARDPAHAWSLAALGFGALAAALDTVLIVSTQDDLADLRWPLILLPLVLVPAPVVWPRPVVRVVAALGMLVWCWLTTFSIGPLFLPSLALMIVAAARSSR
jgi:hypothetical protein